MRKIKVGLIQQSNTADIRVNLMNLAKSIEACARRPLLPRQLHHACDNLIQSTVAAAAHDYVIILCAPARNPARIHFSLCHIYFYIHPVLHEHVDDFQQMVFD